MIIAAVFTYSLCVHTGAMDTISSMSALFPLVAPVIGRIGAFVTGSGTSSGLLFGSVQLQAADALHLDPYWIVALNSLGVGAGKMISPQTLAIGMAAVQVVGAEGKLLNRVLPYAIGFLVLMAGLGMVGAMLF